MTEETTMAETIERPIVLRLRRGTYQGPGCPGPAKRRLLDDRGYGYDAHHPARCHWVRVRVRENGAERFEDRFEWGEEIRLWPRTPGDPSPVVSREQAEAEAARLLAVPGAFERIDVQA
jgi:hypothetical protein